MTVSDLSFDVICGSKDSESKKFPRLVVGSSLIRTDGRTRVWGPTSKIWLDNLERFYRFLRQDYRIFRWVVPLFDRIPQHCEALDLDLGSRSCAYYWALLIPSTTIKMHQDRVTGRTARRNPASGFIRSFRRGLKIRPEWIFIQVSSFSITIHILATITTTIDSCSQYRGGGKHTRMSTSTHSWFPPLHNYIRHLQVLAS